MSASGSTPDRRALPGLVAGLILALQLDFALRDPRLPHDSNAALLHLPAMALALMRGDWLGGFGPVAAPGGWQELCLALVALATNRSALAWHAWFTGWLLLAALGVYRSARAVREDAALPALLLFVGFPVVWEQARIGWLHLPELALVLVATSELLAGGGPMSRGRTLRVALAVALLGSLRGSGVVWGGLLALTALLRGRGAGDKPALVGLLAAVGVGALVTGPTLSHYAGEKLEASTRYGFLAGGKGLLVLQQSLGVTETWLLAFALGLAIAAWPGRRRREAVALAALGLGLPLVSVFALASPVTNTPVFLGAAAVLGGVGLAHLGRWGSLAAFLVAIPVLPLQWLPEATLGAIPAPPRWVRYVTDDPQNYQRVYPHPLAEALYAPLAACAAKHDPCILVTQSGLFATTPEEAGRLELFFLGFDPERFRLLTPRQPPAASPVDVVVRYTCQTSTRTWARRHPDYAPLADALILAHGLTEEREIPAGPGCSYRWNEAPR